MKKIYISILVVFVFFPQDIYLQECNRSILFEIPIIKSELHTNNYFRAQKIGESNSIKYSSGLYIFYSWRFNIVAANKLELRPGILLGDLDIMGIDLGLFLRSDLYWKFFSIVGTNIHYNFGYRENHNTWDRSSQGGIYFIPGGSLGFIVSKKISVLAGYYIFLKNNWRDSWSSDVTSSSYSTSNEKLNWMIKVGLEINH